MPSRKQWKPEELERIKEVYSSGIKLGDGKLDALADELGVHKTNLCRKARALGLTINKGRQTTQEFKDNVGLRTREWLQTNEHPKGFLGGN